MNQQSKNPPALVHNTGTRSFVPKRTEETAPIAPVHALFPVPFREAVRVYQPPQLGSMPAVVDSEGEWIPLFHIFALAQEHLDFISLCDDLPNLSAGLIDEALDFIYRALQANAASLNVERLIEQHGHGKTLFSALQRSVTRFRTASSSSFIEVEYSVTDEGGKQIEKNEAKNPKGLIARNETD